MKIDSDRAKINPAAPCIILLDNGSRRAASTINLRHLADGLSKKEQRDIHPVSLLHSDKVAPSELNGQPAQILEPFLMLVMLQEFTIVSDLLDQDLVTTWT